MFEKGNKEWKKRKKDGRDGFGIENAKKHLLEQAYWIVNKQLGKMAVKLTEKEKIEVSKQIVLKEMGSRVDLTSKGDKIKFSPIYDKQSVPRHVSDEKDI